MKSDTLFTKHNLKYNKTLFNAAWLDTPLGTMLAIADENFLYLLEFVDGRGITKAIERLQKRMQSKIVLGTTKPIHSIKSELIDYFAGTLKTFNTPFVLIGTDFQQSVWHALTTIPYGHTKSYADQARTISKPSACRAVANANGANQLAIIVPCHRIITSNGTLGGYDGGITRKQWLLAHERNNQL